MRISGEILDPDARAAIMAEYATLREELLKRIDLRQQLISITLTLAAVFLGVGLDENLIALIYPVLAALLALAWWQNDSHTRRAGSYIREEHEQRIAGLFWETFCEEQRGGWRSVVVAHGGIFLTTQLMGIGVGLVDFTSTTPEFILLGADAFSMACVGWLFWKSR